MNQTELLQAVIVNAVEKGIRDGLEKGLKPLKEELKQIKALNAKILKEQTNIQASGKSFTPQGGYRQESLNGGQAHQNQQPVNEAVRDHIQEEMAMNVLKSQAAPYAKADGQLPDIDIPIELFLRK